MPQLNIPGTFPKENVEDMTFSLPQPEPIKGFPELRWAGKRPFTSTHYFPAQLKEQYGDPVKGWMNRIYWGDNLQVMSHLLKEFRGKVDLVYIDPPFDSAADYKLSIKIKGKKTLGDISTFEEKQYNDIWANDEYIQFIYERSILIRELMSDKGFFLIHCDYRKSHYIRAILDEVFGRNAFKNEIIIKRPITKNLQAQFERISSLSCGHDNIFVYAKNKNSKIKQAYDRFESKETEGYWHRFWSGEDRPTMRYELLGVSINSGQWKWEKNRALKAYKNYCDFLKEKSNRKNFGEDLSLKDFWIETGCNLEFLRKSSTGTVENWFPPTDKKLANTLWTECKAYENHKLYPTQKHTELLEYIITRYSDQKALVLDCFMGSGTTQAVAMKLGRRFIGADINLGAIQTTTKRLNGIIQEKKAEQRSLLAADDPLYLNFQVYNVNNYDVFRNPVQAKELLLQALEIDPLNSTDVFDGMKDGYRVKIMPVNRIATRADLNPIITGMNYRELDRQLESSPGAVLDRIMLVCMGHEPDLAVQLQMEIGRQYRIDVKVVDILREKERGLTFKYDSEADIVVEGKELVIRQFYPHNLLQKLSLLEENVEEWRELVETVAIDWNYNGEVLQPAVYDSPGKNDLVRGRYPIPEDHGIIRVKITDLLSESLETSLEVE